MVKEIINKEDKGEGTSSRTNEAILSLISIKHACSLTCKPVNLYLRGTVTPFPITLILICYATCLIC
jgi:hypothetical protein